MDDKIKVLADEFFALLHTSKQRQELIDGKVMALESCTALHQQTVIHICHQIQEYIHCQSEPCGTVLPFFWAKPDNHNVLCPDIMITLQEVLPDSICFEGVPDWIIEVVSSDESKDYFEKLELYKNLGIREYWIINPVRKTTTVLILENEFSNLTLYPSHQHIPVHIYRHMNSPLAICIEKYNKTELVPKK